MSGELRIYWCTFIWTLQGRVFLYILSNWIFFFFSSTHSLKWVLLSIILNENALVSGFVFLKLRSNKSRKNICLMSSVTEPWYNPEIRKYRDLNQKWGCKNWGNICSSGQRGELHYWSFAIVWCLYWEDTGVVIWIRKSFLEHPKWPLHGRRLVGFQVNA